jgi:hypothetical protein
MIGEIEGAHAVLGLKDLEEAFLLSWIYLYAVRGRVRRGQRKDEQSGAEDHPELISTEELAGDYMLWDKGQLTSEQLGYNAYSPTCRYTQERCEHFRRTPPRLPRRVLYMWFWTESGFTCSAHTLLGRRARSG